MEIAMESETVLTWFVFAFWGFVLFVAWKVATYGMKKPENKHKHS